MSLRVWLLAWTLWMPAMWGIASDEPDAELLEFLLEINELTGDGFANWLDDNDNDDERVDARQNDEAF